MEICWTSRWYCCHSEKTVGFDWIAAVAILSAALFPLATHISTSSSISCKSWWLTALIMDTRKCLTRWKVFCKSFHRSGSFWQFGMRKVVYHIRLIFWNTRSLSMKIMNCWSQMATNLNALIAAVISALYLQFEWVHRPTPVKEDKFDQVDMNLPLLPTSRVCLVHY